MAWANIGSLGQGKTMTINPFEEINGPNSTRQEKAEYEVCHNIGIISGNLYKMTSQEQKEYREFMEKNGLNKKVRNETSSINFYPLESI